MTGSEDAASVARDDLVPLPPRLRADVAADPARLHPRTRAARLRRSS